jgi:LysM repeat protein
MQRFMIRSAIVLLFVLAGLGASIIVPVSAECRPPADWGAYTVVRGDTLFSIARRFNTTAATLAQGNCLYNPNYLLVGQVIRVPGRPSAPHGGTAPDFPVAASQIGSTYQAFENGFMIWRATTGGIWVFVYQGQNGGYVTQIPLNVYGGMSGDARYWQPIPAGRGLPVFGFKKVYDNFPDLRAGLGWAIGGEQGFLMAVQPEGHTFTISLPDQRLVRINNSRGWQFASGTPTPPPPPTTISTGATFQPFQHGFMVWRADTGEIRVFFGATTGELAVYPASQYGPLPGWPFVQPGVPYQYPVQFGFGKVWNNIPGVRQRLGWATGGERGYTMVVEPASFTLPGGYVATNVGGNTWTVSAPTPVSAPLYGDNAPVPIPTFTPTPTPHMDGVPQVNQFSASTDHTMPGETITLSWNVSGVENVGFTVKYVADYRLFFDFTSERLPNIGSTIVTIPDHTDVYDSDATIQLYWPVGDTPEQWQAIDSGLLTVHIGCPYAVFWNPNLCAQGPVEELPAVFQPFEHGFMLQIAGAVYPVIFDDAHTAMLFVDPEPVELGTPPEGLLAPDAVFVDTWTSTPRYQELLGWAVAPAASYISHAQTEHYRIRDDTTAHRNDVTMPDSRVMILTGSVLGGPILRWDWAE